MLTNDMMEPRQDGDTPNGWSRCVEGPGSCLPRITQIASVEGSSHASPWRQALALFHSARTKLLCFFDARSERASSLHRALTVQPPPQALLISAPLPPTQRTTEPPLEEIEQNGDEQWTKQC